MNSLIKVVRVATSQLDGIGARYALVGGLAVSARTEPRFTRDADFAVAIQSDEEAESVVRHFVSEGYRVESAIEQDEQKRLATIRLSPLENGEYGAVVDLLFASSGIEQEIVSAADPIELFDDVIIPVACIGHLLVLKILSQSDNRPQDRQDIHMLLKHATENDLSTADNAAKLITERGYERGRNLAEKLKQVLSR